jgi:hypothetical protein
MLSAVEGFFFAYLGENVQDRAPEKQQKDSASDQKRAVWDCGEKAVTTGDIHPQHQ